ncbi:MAG: response regulator [Verrucomicrobia bacterium]|nr:response regulator [Verrucomicrobiota bacterium]
MSPHRRQTILIVDDVPANLGVLLDFLGDAGYEVLVAESGTSALEQVSYARPDIILLDVLMPGLDGFETCRRLQADPKWKDTPILFLSALSEGVDKVRGFENGAVDFISKPLHPQEVLARVRAHLQIRALQVDLAEQNERLRDEIALRTEAELELRESLDRAVLVAASGGEIHFCSRVAQGILERWFGPDSARRLPAEAAAWLAGSRTQEPWKRERGGLQLTLRTAASDSGSGHARLLLVDEFPLAPAAASPAPLLALGLTQREAEVLYWIAQGKTSPEIAVIVSAAPNTIKKHVGNILLKLGVETRLAAALKATEVLAR